MGFIDKALKRPPDVINPQGEEIWTNITTNMALVRLKPGTSSQHHYHQQTKEFYSVVRGRATLYLDGVKSILAFGPIIRIDPGVKHHILNETNNDVIFLVQTDRPWDPTDQYLVECSS